MSLDLAVEVPTADEADLVELAGLLDAEPTVVRSHPFDGENAIQLVLLLTTAGYPYFRTWLTARANSGKQCSVVVKGMKLSGYSANEVETILKTLEKSLKK